MNSCSRCSTNQSTLLAPNPFLPRQLACKVCCQLVSPLSLGTPPVRSGRLANSRAGVVHLGPGGRQRVLLQHLEPLQLQLGVRVAAGAPPPLTEVGTLVVEVPLVRAAKHALKWTTPPSSQFQWVKHSGWVKFLALNSECTSNTNLQKWLHL